MSDYDEYNDGWLYCDKCDKGFNCAIEWETKEVNGYGSEGNCYCTECFKIIMQRIQTYETKSNSL